VCSSFWEGPRPLWQASPGGLALVHTPWSHSAYTHVSVAGPRCSHSSNHSKILKGHPPCSENLWQVRESAEVLEPWSTEELRCRGAEVGTLSQWTKTDSHMEVQVVIQSGAHVPNRITKSQGLVGHGSQNG
jgi:hypothetical protein